MNDNVGISFSIKTTKVVVITRVQTSIHFILFSVALINPKVMCSESSLQVTACLWGKSYQGFKQSRNLK